MNIIDSVPPLFFALGATLCFSYSSTIFTEFSRSINPQWMNAFKAIVALILFSFTVIFFNLWTPPTLLSLNVLLVSGLLGLMIGDMYMLKAMKELGASRMLMIFGLQPFFLGLAGSYFFGQIFSIYNLIGVLFMLGCLYTISFENYKKSGSWQLIGLTHGLLAILLDGIGIILTRQGFESTTGITPIQVNLIRCFGACLGFLVYHFSVQKIPIINTFKNLPKGKKLKLLVGSAGGTYLSLMLYLTAVSKGQLSVVSSVTVTGPMFAQVFECIQQRKLPNKLVFLSFIFFAAGFWVFAFKTKS